MNELARKGLFSIIEINNNRYIDFGGVMGCLFKVSIEELSNLKDCISQVTAKKIEVEKDINGVLYFRCPDCNTYVDRDDGYCSRCGIKLEGVGE